MILPSENDTVIGGNCPKCGGSFIDCNCQEFKETPLQQASKIYKKTVQHKTEFGNMSDLDFIAGANWQAESMYTEEEVYELLLKHQSAYRSAVRNTSPLDWSFDIKQWFEQFKNK